MSMCIPSGSYFPGPPTGQAGQAGGRSDCRFWLGASCPDGSFSPSSVTIGPAPRTMMAFLARQVGSNNGGLSVIRNMVNQMVVVKKGKKRGTVGRYLGYLVGGLAGRNNRGWRLLVAKTIPDPTNEPVRNPEPCSDDSLLFPTTPPRGAVPHRIGSVWLCFKSCILPSLRL